MSDAKWALVRELPPVPGWLAGRGGRPGGFCHRQMIDALRYLVDNGIKWRAMPADYPLPALTTGVCLHGPLAACRAGGRAA
ncbi:transposase [Streptomyces pseudogriseolus]|uniref:transposase n=1 Tax=Streptomyces pseudogriseolus TaxID=36817 RepID=UPI00349A3EED